MQRINRREKKNHPKTGGHFRRRATEERIRKMKKTTEKSIIKAFEEMPSMWTKCPKCNELLYAKEVGRLNKCTWMGKGCGYVFPYPVAKVQKVGILLRNPKSTYGELSALILEILDSIIFRNEKLAFLSVVIGLVQSSHERRLIQVKK